jgi:nicotinate-nucleotide adenylyltransferase
MIDDRLKVPPAEPGMRIGLFGGSFNPPHEGHRLVALQSLKRLALDKLWLLVTPGNPLKDHRELAPLERRVDETVKLMDDPRVVVTAFEASKGFTYTYETLSFLAQAHPRAEFVWIMGADSLQNFDRWERWQDITRLMPIAVYDRPGLAFSAITGPAAQSLEPFRLPEAEARTLAGRPPPAWVYLHGMVSPQSSSAIRAAQQSSA